MHVLSKRIEMKWNWVFSYCIDIRMYDEWVEILIEGNCKWVSTLSLSPSFWIVMAFDELIFPCLVGVSDDRTATAMMTTTAVAANCFRKTSECVCEMESVTANTRNISQLMDRMNSFAWLNEQRTEKNRKGKSANTTAGKCYCSREQWPNSETSNWIKYDFAKSTSKCK